MHRVPQRTAAAMAASILAAAAAATLAPPTAARAQNTDKPIVIGHRGASGERPEHTLAAYALAIEQGADFVEPDLVVTKDGVLVARHENEISGTTDVAARAEFAGRQTTKTIDGVSVTGWFTEDFTLAELKTLRAKERIPQLRPGNTAYDGQFEVPTLQEVIDLVKTKELETGRTIGIYPETKHPTFMNAFLAASGQNSFERKLVDTLTANGYAGPAAAVFIQSFEVSNLKYLNTITDLPLVQLLGGSGTPFDDARTYDFFASLPGLTEVATYADGLGPNKDRVIGRDALGNLLAQATSLVGDAHGLGLLVHPYTFRAENFFLPKDLRNGANPSDHGNFDEELRRFFEAGVDGVFTDFPGRGVAARDAFVAAQAVPEPGTLALAGPAALGLAAAGIARRRRRRGTDAA